MKGETTIVKGACFSLSQLSRMKKSNVSLVCGKVYAPSTDNPSKTKEYRSFFLRTYCTEDEVLSLLENLSLEAYAYIIHDKDVDENGELHQEHIHLLAHLQYPYKVRATKIAKYLVSGNTRLELVKDKYKAYDYLTHKNSPDKFQYQDEEVRYQNKAFYIANTLASKEEQRAEKMAELLDDVLTLSRRDFALIYGRDGILNYDRYRAFALSCQSPEVVKLTSFAPLLSIAQAIYDDYRKDLHFAHDNKVLMRFISAITDELLSYADISPLALFERFLNAYARIIPQSFDDDQIFDPTRLALREAVVNTYGIRGGFN